MARDLVGSGLALRLPIEITVRLGRGGSAVSAGIGRTGEIPTPLNVLGTAGLESDVPAASVVPMDVLLYRGRSFMSKAIQFLDGTDVSHAGLSLGGGMVGEALSNGLVRNTLATSFGDSEWVMARRLKATPLPDSRPVLDRAEAYLRSGVPYAYHQLVLLAFLCVSRKVKVTPIFDALVRKTLDGAAALLHSLISSGKRVMICSEYVFRCFDEATPRRLYDLHLNELMARPEGVAPGYDMSVARRPIGHGVHAESIFAWASRSATGPFMALRPPASLYPAGGTHEAVSDPSATLAEIEELSRRYLAEVREVGTPEARVGVDVVALRTSVERFALALQAATTGQPLRAPEGVSDSLKSAFDHLYRTAADFVTPGDLYKADSLFTVGRVVQS